MEQSVSHLPLLPRLADYIHEHRDAIGRMWTQWVKESPDVPGAAHIPPEALQDHIPALMEDLVGQMRLEREGATVQSAGHSRIHGREQWKAGYKISELIWEIYIIRRVLTETVIVDFAQDHPEYSMEERDQAGILIHDFFHRVTCEAVAQFVEEQQKAIQETNDELQQTADSRERLTRTIAHELRNVLNALTQSISLLGEEPDEKQRAVMIASCSRMLSDMAGILNELLDYSALISGHSQLTLEQFSLPELFDEIVSEWRPVAEECGLIFETKCDATLGQIVSDKLKVKQIAGNLLSNAIKFRKRSQKGYVGISFSAYEGSGWRIVVVDTGIGIAPEDMESLFGEFGRIRSESAVTGTGLGLAITKEFAELLGGHVEVSSEARQGTRFEVTLPMNKVMDAGGLAG